MNELQANLAGSAFQPKMEKKWDDRTPEERVEVLRQEVRMLREVLNHVSRAASNARDLAETHQHSHTGEVLQPANRRGGGAESVAGRRDPLA